MSKYVLVRVQLASMGNMFYMHAEYDFVEYINLVIIYIYVGYIRNTYGTYVLISRKKVDNMHIRQEMEVSMSKDFLAIIKPNIFSASVTFCRCWSYGGRRICS